MHIHSQTRIGAGSILDISGLFLLRCTSGFANSLLCGDGRILAREAREAVAPLGSASGAGYGTLQSENLHE
jgi:hypothetical protein